MRDKPQPPRGQTSTATYALSMTDLAERVIAIAGVGGGLGPAVAERLGDAGAIVAGADREQEAARRARRPSSGSASAGTAARSTSPTRTRCGAWRDGLVERFGRVDGLIHLVGGWRGGQPLHEEPLADWDLLHELLIRTVQLTTRAFHDQLAASAHGRFVLVSAKQAQRPSNGNAAYAAAKAAAEAWTLAYADGFGPGGATANIIVVDAILTPRMRGREPRQGVPDLHPGRAHRRRDRLALLRRRGGDERRAPAPYDALMAADKKAAAEPDGKMTIGELARRTGMTIRNIRAHQTRGLLPPPEVQGRTGYYNEEHVARIELTREMQAEGLNLEAIRRVLESTGGSSKEMVDFARAVRAPFEDETPEIFERRRTSPPSWRVETVDEKLLQRAEKLGVLRVLPDGKVEVISPRLHRAAARMIEFGVSPEAAVAVGGEAARARRRASPAPTSTSSPSEIWEPFDKAGRPEEDWHEGARGARGAAPARLRRPAGDVPDHDGRGDREGRRTDPPQRRQTAATQPRPQDAASGLARR